MMQKISRDVEVVARRPDGLGTRLLAILSARVFADKHGLKLSIIWPSMNDPHYNFKSGLLQADTLSDVFSGNHAFIDRLDIKFVDESFLHGKQIFSMFGTFGDNLNSGESDINTLTTGYDAILYDYPGIFKHNSYSEDDDLETLKKCWNLFNFNREVVDLFISWKEHTNLSDSVAVHIRRGDMPSMLCNSDFDFLRHRGIHIIFQRYIPTATVINLLEGKFSRYESIVICSEDNSPLRNLANMLPHKNFFSSFGLFKPDSNQQALFDLLVLANAAVLISPYKSFYSECAALVGKCARYNAGLDVPNLTRELCDLINCSDVSNADRLRSLVLIVGWQNMWQWPESEERVVLLERAKSFDKALVEEMVLANGLS